MSLALIAVGIVLFLAPQGGVFSQDPKIEKIPEPANPWELVSRHDADGDGRVSAKEYDRGAERFARLDRDQDGFLTAADFGGPARRGGRAGAAGEAREKPPQPPKAGDVAPDFELPLLAAEKPTQVKLSSFRGKKPVALIFGSYT